MWQATEKTHYEVLGIPPGTDSNALREAYIALALRHHPDRPGHQPEVFAAITEAYAVLKDPARRKVYDATLAVLVKQCGRCGGSGQAYRMRGFTRREELVCPACGGTGRA